MRFIKELSSRHSLQLAAEGASTSQKTLQRATHSTQLQVQLTHLNIPDEERQTETGPIVGVPSLRFFFSPQVSIIPAFLAATEGSVWEAAWSRHAVFILGNHLIGIDMVTSYYKSTIKGF